MRWMRALGAGVLVIVLGACVATAPTPAPDGIAYRDDPDLQRVWLAEGFQFRGVQVFHVEDPRADVPNVNPDGVENLTWARTLFRDEVVTALRATTLFPLVTVQAADATTASRVLRLQTTIIEYEKGGGGARFFAGLYGAGQPVIRVRGRVIEGDRTVFGFDARRSGDTGVSRLFGGYRSDKAIQEEDIRDLAQDLAAFIARGGSR